MSFGLGLALPYRGVRKGGATGSAPSIADPGFMFVPENTDFVASMMATGTAPITWSIFAGMGEQDGPLFMIDPGTGELYFIAAPDFENPQDSDVDNIYGVLVIATNAFGSDVQQVVTFVTDVVGAIDYTLLRLTADSGAVVNNGVVSWNSGSAVVDELSAYNFGAQPTRLTVPADTSYVRLTGNVILSGDTGSSGAEFLKAGAVFMGGARNILLPGPASLVAKTLASPPLQVSAADYFELNTDGDNSYIIESDRTQETEFAMIRESVEGFSGVLLKKATDFSALNAATTLAWDTEVYDVGGWHEGVTNPSRITIPTGVTRVQLYGSTQMTEDYIVGDPIGHSYFKAGAATRAAVNIMSYFTTGTLRFGQSTCTGPLAVTAGDYFELRTRMTDPNYGLESDTSYFAAQALPSALPAARVFFAADVTALNATAGHTIAWDSEEFDDAVFHDNVTNNTRLTVPTTGLYQVGGSTHSSAITFPNETRLVINHRNSAGTLIAVVTGSGGTPASAISGLSCVSNPVSCTAGDYFDMTYTQLTDTSITLTAAECTFWIQKMR